uniref:Uncharacterized protein n=1 Tax=viral metagenome TaxID=1070528 RepID=A0A6M3JLC4_9ZZZZ
MSEYDCKRCGKFDAFKGFTDSANKKGYEIAKKEVEKMIKSGKHKCRCGTIQL